VIAGELVLALCLFGPDGSGKSTLANHVAGWFRGRGFCVAVVWLRGTHTLASIFARLLARFSRFRGPCNPYYWICVPRKPGKKPGKDRGKRMRTTQPNNNHTKTPTTKPTSNMVSKG